VRGFDARPKLVPNIVTTLSAQIAIAVIALLSSVVLARVLGPEDRGLLALVVLLPELAAMVGLLGIDEANAVYAGLAPTRRPALVWQSAAIACAVGAVLAVATACVIVLGVPGVAALVRGPLWLYLLPLATLPYVLVTAYWRSILRGMNHIPLITSIAVSTKFTGTVLVIAFVAGLRWGVPGAIWANVLLDVGSAVVMVPILRRVGALARPELDWSLWRRTLGFAVPAYGATLAAYLTHRVDAFIVAAFLPAADLGYYVIAVGLVERIWIVPGAVGSALLPHLTNSRDREPAALSAVMARHVMIWTGAACILVWAVAGLVVPAIYSSAFAPVVAPFRWLLPGVFTLSVGKVVVAELLAREKPRYGLSASIVASLVNIAGSLILVPRIGISGAALAASLAYSVLSVLLIRYYMRETGVPWTALVPGRSDLLSYVAFCSRWRAMWALKT
jgi:O-antigen/teichoic acid export membrane protein